MLAAVPRLAAGRPLDLAAVETTALHTAATLLAAAAAARTESRGCHRRTDAPDTRPGVGGPPRRTDWTAPGRLHTRTEPRPRTPVVGMTGGLRPDLAAALQTAGLDPAEVERVVRRALDEDLALGPDVTTDSRPSPPTRAPPATSSPGRPACWPGSPVAAAVFDLVGGPRGRDPRCTPATASAAGPGGRCSR